MKLLRVDMKSKTIETTDLPRKWNTIGGSGLIAKIMNKEVPPAADPLGSYNKLIVACGPLAGTLAPQLGRISVGAKSPLTLGIKEANSGGPAAQYMDNETVDAIWNAIQAEQLVNMPLFSERNRKLDFSQFTVRGHYAAPFWGETGQRTLGDYFKAMMWLGRMDFLLTPPPENPWELPWGREEIRRMNLGAVMLNELVGNKGVQLNLFDTTDRDKSLRLMETIDEINNRGARKRIRWAVEGVDQPWSTRFSHLSKRYTTRWDELPEV